jgi:formylglycine-generating enzyme required for sulfatase activity
MNEVHAERNNPWPFFAISILVLLLAAFLYLRISQKNDPMVAAAPWASSQKNPDVPSSEKGSLDLTPFTERSVIQDPPEKKEEKQEEEVSPQEKRKALILRAKKALKNNQFEDALSAIEEARKIRAAEDLDTLTEQVSKAKEVFVREQAELELLSKDLVLVADLWEKVWKKKNLWKTSVDQLEALEKKHPIATRSSDYLALRKMVVQAYSDYSGAFKANVLKAQNLQGAGRTADALARLRIALSLFPEREEEVTKLREEWENIIHSRNMIRVSNATVKIGGEDHSDEKPVRSFEGKVFWIDQYEVTNEDYAAFLLSNSERPAPPAISGWRGRKPPKEKEKHPVTYVTYGDAEAYATWAKKRLPTAEEWEKAARFLKGETWPWGNDFPPPGSDEFFANSMEYWQRYKNRVPGTTPVGSFPKGRGDLDLFDMAGNVWEWTSTRVPIDKDGKSVNMVVVKGGSFMTAKEALRSSNRLVEHPLLAHPDTGFRCVRD